MNRIIEIDTCADCPWFDCEYFDFNHECTRLDRVIRDDIIPDDCPLPTAPKKVNPQDGQL